MENINEPSFFAVIPASVRYDKNISDAAKLIYAEITSLSNKEGYCWANNEYFAGLFDKHPNTISRIISELSKNKHVDVDLQTTPLGTKRKIYPLLKNDKGGTQKQLEGYSKTFRGVNENVKQNNKSNNKDNNKSNKEKSDFEKKSHTPAKNENLDLDNSNQFAMPKSSSEILEQKEPTQPTARKNKKEKEVEKLIAFIDSYPKPENVDAILYEKLQDFVKSRIERSEMITVGGWGLLIGKTQRAQEKYGIDAICSHIENGIIANSWKSPFFNEWENKMPVVAKNAITTKIEGEKPFEEAEKEASFNRTINSIKEKFEFIENATCKIRQINRKEFAELFGLGANKAISNFIFKNGKNGLWTVYCNALLSLAADKNLNFDNRTLYSILLDAFKKANEANKNG